MDITLKDSKPVPSDEIKRSTQYYSEKYDHFKTDTPEPARNALAILVRKELANNHPNGVTTPDEPGHSSYTVVDIGSGTDVLFKQVLNPYSQTHTMPKCTCIAVDIAPFASHKLSKIPGTRNDNDILKFLATHKPETPLPPQMTEYPAEIIHVRADAQYLPLKTASVDLAVANFALDFAGSKGRFELARIVKPGGKAILNLDHPALIPENIDELIETGQWKNHKEEIVLRHRKFLKDANMLMHSKDEIIHLFQELGFDSESVEERITADRNNWWEVVLIRNNKSYEQIVHDYLNSLDNKDLFLLE